MAEILELDDAWIEVGACIRALIDSAREHESSFAKRLFVAPLYEKSKNVRVECAHQAPEVRMGYFASKFTNPLLEAISTSNDDWAMRQETRDLWNAYCESVKRLNNAFKDDLQRRLDIQ